MTLDVGLTPKPGRGRRDLLKAAWGVKGVSARRALEVVAGQAMADLSGGLGEDLATTQRSGSPDRPHQRHPGSTNPRQMAFVALVCDER